MRNGSEKRPPKKLTGKVAIFFVFFITNIERFETLPNKSPDPRLQQG